VQDSNLLASPRDGEEFTIFHDKPPMSPSVYSSLDVCTAIQAEPPKPRLVDIDVSSVSASNGYLSALTVTAKQKNVVMYKPDYCP